MWKKSFLFHEKSEKLSMMQNLSMLIMGVMCVYYWFSLSGWEVYLGQAMLAAMLLLLGFDLSFTTFLMIINNSYSWNLNFNKLYFWLWGMMIPLLLMWIWMGLEQLNIMKSNTEELMLIMNVMMMLFWSPLWIIFMMLWVIESKSEKSSQSKLENLKNNAGTNSFLFSLVIFTMCLWIFTWDEFKTIIPSMFSNLNNALMMSFLISMISYFVVYFKLLKVDKNSLKFMDKTLHDKSFDGDMNYDIWYETYNKIMKEMKEDYKNNLSHK